MLLPYLEVALCVQCAACAGTRFLPIHRPLSTQAKLGGVAVIFAQRGKKNRNMYIVYYKCVHLDR